MTNTQQLSWVNLEHYIVQMEKDSGQSADHIRASLKHVRETGANAISARHLDFFTNAMRSCYNLGKGKATV